MAIEPADRVNDRRARDRFNGCLLGGAVGDALGAAVEFMSLAAIRSKYGEPGITDYDYAYCLAAIIHALSKGTSLIDSIERALTLLEGDGNTGSEETAAAIRGAVDLWRSWGGDSSPELIERMGGGWVGEEALAISLFCALAAGGDFAKGVLLAVNHSGDSDSTGAITGNILGLMLGDEAIPGRWLEELELRAEIEVLAGDLFAIDDMSREWWERYPGW